MKLHSLEEAREEVIKRSSETEYSFAIVLKESGKVIGEIDAYPEPADEHGADSEKDTFSPCWMLNKAYHGKGYAYEAAHAPVLQYETEEEFFSFVAKTDFTESHHRFDQCGIVMYLDSENWLKGSVEYENHGVPMACS